MSDVINGVSFWSFRLRLPRPGPNLIIDGSILLKFLLETK